jgi:hypothetical protein
MTETRPAPDNGPRSLLVCCLLDASLTRTLTPLQWDLLLRQGRRTNLLGKLTALLEAHGLLDSVPDQVYPHLLSAARISQRQRISFSHEADLINEALAQTGVGVILLKGAAYLVAGLPAARGRIFSDVDILVPKTAMARVESDLMIHGWQSSKVSPYDQRYYRRWMHEIPPMMHVRRSTTIDVHHAILPPSARIKVNTALLFEGAAPVAGKPGLFILKPTDMFLHSATHLFHEGEMENGLRDLFDLDSLLRHFGAQPGFWEELAPRAAALGLMRPLYYAIRYTVKFADTPVPAAVVAASLPGAPADGVVKLMDFCYRCTLKPLHSSTKETGGELARALLYVRSHWIRMPLHLLAIHLARKMFARPESEDAATPAGEAKQEGHMPGLPER